MLTVEPECPAYAEYFAQSPLRPVVPGLAAEPAVVAVVVLVPLEEQATRTRASTGAARDAAISGRLRFDVIHSSSIHGAAARGCKRYRRYLRTGKQGPPHATGA